MAAALASGSESVAGRKPAFLLIDGDYCVNTNLIHNILNVLILIFGAMAGFDFTSLGISVALSAKLAASAAALKLVINALRDGFVGMAKPQPPVVQ
jgi:hypothetical protein